MTTILFILFMAFFIAIAKEKFLYCFVLVFGLAVKAGYTCNIIGLAVWIGLLKIINDIIYAGSRD